MKQSSLPFSSIFADEMRQYLELAESADKVTESYYYTFKRLDDFIVKQNYQEKIFKNVYAEFYQLTFSMHGLIRLIPVQGAEPVKPVVYGNLHDILMR